MQRDAVGAAAERRRVKSLTSAGALSEPRVERGQQLEPKLMMIFDRPAIRLDKGLTTIDELSNQIQRHIQSRVSPR